MNLYHGTDADIPVGGKVLPGNQVGKSNFPGVNRTERGQFGQQEVVNASTREGTGYTGFGSDGGAWHFALTSAGKHGGRAKVYEVAPHPEQQVGRYHPDHPNYSGYDYGEYKAPHFEVLRESNIMPGRQGTLPINWRQFSTSKNQSLDTVNHPTEDQVVWGHELQGLHQLMSKDPAEHAAAIQNLPKGEQTNPDVMGMYPFRGNTAPQPIPGQERLF